MQKKIMMLLIFFLSYDDNNDEAVVVAPVCLCGGCVGSCCGSCSHNRPFFVLVVRSPLLSPSFLFQKASLYFSFVTPSFSSLHFPSLHFTSLPSSLSGSWWRNTTTDSRLASIVGYATEQRYADVPPSS